jgi:hypothetical protein
MRMTPPRPRTVAPPTTVSPPTPRQQVPGPSVGPADPLTLPASSSPSFPVDDTGVREPRVSVLALFGLAAVVFAWAVLAITGKPAPLVAVVALVLATVARRVIRRQVLGGGGVARVAQLLCAVNLVVTVPLLLSGETAA